MFYTKCTVTLGITKKASYTKQQKATLKSGDKVEETVEDWMHGTSFLKKMIRICKII